MELIRVIDPIHYDPAKREFKSLAFKNGDNHKITVFDSQCAVDTSRSVCNHISAFYVELTGTPHLYWPFSQSKLPPEAILEHEISDQGDECHYNLTGLRDKPARRLLKEQELAGFFYCPENRPQSASHETLEELRLRRYREMQGKQ